MEQEPPPDPHFFIFEIDRAIRTQVIEKLEASPQLPLSKEAGPPKKGVYVLYRGRDLVYAGKALYTTLRRRLGEHTSKINSRPNISIKEMKCRFLTIDSDWFVRAAEEALIVSYKPIWNTSGFGSHVPGVGRPGVRISKWNKLFPPK